jgi:cytochrome c oxidase subunit IV
MSATETAPETDFVPTEPDETGDHGHASDGLYVTIFGVLFALTALEVSTYFVDFGPLHLPTLLVLMVIKFATVVLFFMHLKFDHRLFTWVFGAGLVLAVAVYGAMLTTFSYWQNL